MAQPNGPPADSQPYQPKGDTFFDDGREVHLLHHIHSLPSLPTIRNSPPAVLAAIDAYAASTSYLMNVGPAKGRIVTDLIAATKPNIMVELGGYIGYSCILFGAALREASGGRAKYFSLERNPEFAAVTMCLVELAGLRDNVHVVVGPSDESLRRLKAEGAFAASKDQEQQIDLMFLDHYKPAYRTDLQLCEELGLIQKGTVLAGDNCIEPGNPPYLEYVRASCADKRRFLEEAEEEEKGEKEEGKGKGGGSGGKGKASQWDDRMADSAMRQYEKREGEGTRDMNVKGVPGIVYESGMVESFEPTGERDGVEITKCLGFEGA